MVDYTTVFVSGTIYWPKIFIPVMNYDGDGKEWAFDFVPDDTSFLKEHRLLDRLKEDKKGNIPGEFLHLKKPEKDREGNTNDPIRVYDKDNQEWDRETKIGNGSRVDIKLTVADFGKGKKKALWTKAIRVIEHVPYVSNEFAGMDGAGAEAGAGDVKVKAKPKTKTQVGFEDLDDDVPF